ncbi:AAA family ATPase [Fimbriiglobus ruber]|uniref:MoxR-like ATPase n=1 Tax=Fimbriiglobus ruber TaxID=1908690 RepID=A0A225DZH6_9BACT|nr:MoxR family ATPase [Fimbriiglobus ruber]OWK46373.1 MoxR-like ATPase [Fimbriiglobus ruber]
MNSDNHPPGVLPNTTVHDTRPASELFPLLTALRDNVAGVFLGKPEVIHLSLVALLAEGHLLLEDVPGVGKTLLAKAVARSLACSFHRIQFTPDLLPGDLIGTSVFHQSTSTFEFQPGPIFAQVILADEINRATPRTQSALLEAMSERQVTFDGQTRHLGPPFIVLATQNPYEFEGTYPLPESQLDRFMLRLTVGYPDRVAERAILTQHRAGEPVDSLDPVLTPADVIALQQHTRVVRVEAPVAEYILELIDATRTHPDVRLGASTRAALALYRAVQALAVVSGRDYATPDDVKTLAVPVLAHRLMTRAWDQGGRDDAAPIVNDLLKRIRVPV